VDRPGSVITSIELMRTSLFITVRYMYYSHARFVQQKMTFPRPMVLRPLRSLKRRVARYATAGARIDLHNQCFSVRRSHIDSSPGGTLGAAETTKINRNQHNSTESAKVITNHQKSSLAPDRSHQKSSIVIKNHQKSAFVAWFLNTLQSLLRSNSGYWNIKECVTGGPGTSYKFLLQTDLYCGIYLYHSDTLLPQHGGGSAMPLRGLRLSDDLKTRLEQAQKLRGYKSVNAFIVEAIEEKLQRTDAVDSASESEAPIAADFSRIVREVRSVHNTQQAQYALLDALTKLRIDVRCRASAGSAGVGQGARQTEVREAPTRSRKDHNRRKRELPLRKRSQCRLATENDHSGCGLGVPQLAHRANGNVHGRAAWGPSCVSSACAAIARR
jgi:hypothetical protein